MESYKVYIKHDAKGRVLEINSDAFLKATAGYIKIDEGMGDRFHHAQGNYLAKETVNSDGTHNYIYSDNQLHETSAAQQQEEKASLAVAPSAPSLEERTAATEAAIMAIMGGM